VEPTSGEFPRITAAALGEAVRIYLERAYASAPLPEAVQRRLGWMDRGEAILDLSAPPFERANRPGPGVPTIVALRLGNERYPQMKLQIQAWPHTAGYLLSINTHDQLLSLNPDARDAEAAREIQAYNQSVKEAIELAWEAAGLPTFLRYLRDYLNTQQAQPSSG
jgi:hypothetical protein